MAATVSAFAASPRATTRGDAAGRALARLSFRAFGAPGGRARAAAAPRDARACARAGAGSGAKRWGCNAIARATSAGAQRASRSSDDAPRDARRARRLARGDAQRRRAAESAGEAAVPAVPPSNPSGPTIVTPKVNKGKLQTRVLSALTLGAFGLFVTCTGGWVWAMWMAGASYLASKEYFTMVPNMQSELPHPPPKWAGDASIFLCTIFALVLQACGAKTSALVMTTLAAFGVVAFLLTTRQDEPHFSQYTATLFGIVYCGALPSFWVKLRALAYSKSATIATGASGSRFVEAWPAVLGGPEAWTTGLIVTVITVSCIIASDVGAYAFGKTFGKTQLIKISPNKTVEGAAGGLLCTMLTAFGLRQLLGWHAGVIQTVALGALIFWAAVAGDLMESVMKRNAGMKDSGDIIPGHGGFLDRFDSYMFTGISVYFYIVTVMPHWFQGLVL